MIHNSYMFHKVVVPMTIILYDTRSDYDYILEPF